MTYESLRTLREELTNVRLAAADTSLWSIIATVNQRARLALNDALRTYPFRNRAIYSSAVIPESGTTIYIPPAIERIVGIEALNTSTGATLIPSDYNHMPGRNTNQVTVYLTKSRNIPYHLRIDYERTLEAFPEQVSVSAEIATTDAVITVHSPGVLLQQWEPQGELEIAAAGTEKCEVVYYNSIDPKVGFYVDRAQRGTLAEYFPLAQSIYLTAVVTMPPEAKVVVMAGAEANMYNFWVSHRALYDQYTAVTGLQQLEIAELLGIVRTQEDRADRRWKRLKVPPPPSRVKVRVRGDR